MTKDREPTYTNWQDVPLFLTVKEAARLLRVHGNTVRAMIADGRLPAVKAGRAWRIRKDDVRALADGREAREE